MYNMSCVRDMANIKNDKHFVPGCGSAWLERLIWDQEVAGSNPVTPTFSRDVSSIFIINKIVRGLWYFFCLSIKRMYLFRYMRGRKIKIKNC